MNIPPLDLKAQYQSIREEINQIVYHGLMVPSGCAFGKASPYYSEEAFKKYSDYDPELARQLLDRAGYVRPDGERYRQLKDGSTFEVTIGELTARLGDTVEPVTVIVSQKAQDGAFGETGIGPRISQLIPIAKQPHLSKHP